VAGFIAAAADPVICVSTLTGAYEICGELPGGEAIALGLLVLVLMVPGSNRFHLTPWRALADVTRTWLYVAGLLWMGGLLTGTLNLYPLKVLMLWMLMAPASLWALAVGGGSLLRWHAGRPTTLRRAVIVGAGPLAVTAAQALHHDNESPTQIVGFFDDRSSSRLDAAAVHQRLGGLSDVAEYVRSQGVAAVYITLPLGSQPRVAALLESLQATTASLFFVPDLFGISVIQGRLQDVNGVPMVGFCETPFTGLDGLLKRGSDLLLALLFIVLAAPLMLVLALGVKLSSPGPAIFQQRRNGLGGEAIVIYKFRSMRTLDDGPQVQQARRGDPRVTRFGALLRRTSLDELPQLFNVLQGRMSIVGPRPHAVAHNEQYAQIIKAYTVRHKVRPGITGWAQVNGFRGETDTLDKMRARVEFDLDYLRNWSLALDLHIILRTVATVLWDRKAY
jgi:putative colanic acid biosynthesis UDP-glucose lipid carrier transferase